MRSIIISIGALAAALGTASAQNTDRYTLEKTENGYVRMDTRTGAMSICETRENQLICRMAADERAAQHSLIDRLQTRIDRLEGRVSKLEGGPTKSVPSEQEFEQGLDFMERFFRRFMGVVRDLDGEPQPDRT